MILLQGIFSGLLNNHDTSLVDTQRYVSVILKKKQAGLLKTELIKLNLNVLFRMLNSHEFDSYIFCFFYHSKSRCEQIIMFHR